MDLNWCFAEDGRGDIPKKRLRGLTFFLSKFFTDFDAHTAASGTARDNDDVKNTAVHGSRIHAQLARLANKCLTDADRAEMYPETLAVQQLLQKNGIELFAGDVKISDPKLGYATKIDLVGIRIRYDRHGKVIGQHYVFIELKISSNIDYFTAACSYTVGPFGAIGLLEDSVQSQALAQAVVPALTLLHFNNMFVESIVVRVANGEARLIKMPVQLKRNKAKELYARLAAAQKKRKPRSKRPPRR